MKTIMFVYYVFGSILWVFLLAAMPATRGDTNALIVNYLVLTIGLWFGLSCRRLIEKRPWVLLFVPIIPVMLGFFGWI